MDAALGVVGAADRALAGAAAARRVAAQGGALPVQGRCALEGEFAVAAQHLHRRWGDADRRFDVGDPRAEQLEIGEGEAVLLVPRGGHRRRRTEAGARVDHGGAAHRPSQRQRDRRVAQRHRRTAVAVDAGEAVERVRAADPVRGPALALLDDHGVESGPRQRPRGEGAARPGADHDRVATRCVWPLRCRHDRHLRVRSRGLVARSDRRDLARERIGTVSEHDHRLDRVERRGAAEPRDLGEQRFALLGRCAAEQTSAASERERLEADERRCEASLRGRGHARDHPPGDARDPLRVRPPSLGRQDRCRHVSQRGHGLILGPAGRIEHCAVPKALRVGAHLLGHLGAARDPDLVSRRR